MVLEYTFVKVKDAKTHLALVLECFEELLTTI
jgi:hypothetical protein